MIKFTHENIFQGPNPYASDPVLVAAIEISADVLADTTGLARSMAKAFAPWFVHTSSDDSDPALSVARFLAAWSLAALNEGSGFLHSAGAKREGDRIAIWVGFHNPKVSYTALDIAAKLFVGIGARQFSDDRLNSAMSSFWELCKAHHPEQVTHVLMQTARDQNIPYMPLLGTSRVWQFGWGRASSFFNRTSPDEDSHHGTVISRDKARSKAFFTRLGVPCAEHVLLRSEAELADAVTKIGWPCVVKPVDGSHGMGVTTGVRSEVELQRAYALARALTNLPIMIESHVEGDTIRLLVVRGKLLAAIRREPPFVVGDDESTVRALIDRINQTRPARRRHVVDPYRIPIDEALALVLARQGLSLDHVLPEGQKVPVRGNANSSTGGLVFDVSGEIHPDIARMAEMLADAFRITVAGIDYITDALDKSPVDGRGAVIEINSFPGLGALIRSGVDARLVGQTVLGSKPGRIPAAVFVTTKSNLPDVGKLLPMEGGAGWICDECAGIGTTRLTVGKRSFVEATKMILQNPRATSVTVACDIGELVRTGLPVDRADRAILYGVTLDKEWARVIDDYCAEVIRVDSVEAARSAMERWAEALSARRG
jgi:cyanophycin synthetase